MLKWNAFIEWAFLGLITFFAYQLNSNISDLQKTISQLNYQVGSIITDNSVLKEMTFNSKDLIKDHELRIRVLEKTK